MGGIVKSIFGKKPKAPPIPDPVATVKAQGDVNRGAAISEAYLNRVDQYTPEGALKWTQTGTNPDGTPKFESHQTYSPEQQRLYDQDTQLSGQMNDIAGQSMSRVAQAMSGPMDTSGFNPLRSSASGGPLRDDVNYQGPGIQYDIKNAGRISDSFGDAGEIQRGLDYSGVSRMPTVDDFSKEAQQANDAVYNQAMSRFNPEFEADQRRIASSLAAKGVTEGSAAWNREMERQGRIQTDARNQATYSGIQAGADRQGQLFGMGLQARQQGVGEVNDQGQFANSAQQQDYEQQYGRGSFARESQAQRFGQNSESADFRNAAQAQGYGQASSETDRFNTNQGTRYAQDAENARFNNEVRNQQYTEADRERSRPFNEIAALMGTSQGVTAPEFAGYNPVSVGAPDLVDATYSSYGLNNDRYKAKVANRNAKIGQAVGLASNAAMAFSDRRLKADIERVGETEAGIPTYVFRYIWENIRRFGVIADEVLKVIPEAVSEHSSGYLMVDYGKVR